LSWSEIFRQKAHSNPANRENKKKRKRHDFTDLRSLERR